MKNRYFQIAGALALAATLGKFYAVPAVAQAVRAAVVRNVDEKGRIPYNVQADCSKFNTPTYCTFPPIPVNKRLVVEYVNGFIAGSSTVYSVGMDHQAGGTMYMGLPVHLTSGSSTSKYYAVSERILTYYDYLPPGSLHERPQIILGMSGNDFTAAFTLTGYLIDLQQ